MTTNQSPEEQFHRFFYDISQLRNSHQIDQPDYEKAIWDWHLQQLAATKREATIQLALHFKDMMLCPMCGNRKPSETCICSSHQICSPRGIDAFIAYQTQLAQPEEYTPKKNLEDVENTNQEEK